MCVRYPSAVLLLSFFMFESEGAHPPGAVCGVCGRVGCSGLGTARDRGSGCTHSGSAHLTRAGVTRAPHEHTRSTKKAKTGRESSKSLKKPAPGRTAVPDPEQRAVRGYGMYTVYV